MNKLFKPHHFPFCFYFIVACQLAFTSVAAAEERKYCGWAVIAILTFIAFLQALEADCLTRKRVHIFLVLIALSCLLTSIHFIFTPDQIFRDIALFSALLVIFVLEEMIVFIARTTILEK